MSDTLVLNRVLGHLREQEGIKICGYGIRSYDNPVTRSDVRIKQARNCSSRELQVCQSPVAYIDSHMTTRELELLIDKCWEREGVKFEARQLETALDR
jgi:hypothetical protein